MRTWLNKIMLIGVMAIAFSSCEKDEVRTVLNVGTTPTLTATPTTLVLTQANANNDAVKFSYTTATFGFDAAVTYVLQISKGGTNFASASTTEVGLSNTSPLEKTFKVVEFNRELLKIINYGVATAVEVRVKATVAAAAPPSYSNVVNMTCTAYRDLITYTYPNAMNIAGNFQGWSPATGPQIVKQNNGGYNGYEGYIIFNAATPEFKMVRGNDWVGDHGDAGSNITNPSTGGGALTANGGNNIKLPSGGAGLAGYYRLRANTTDLTWTYDKITTWGIIGAFNGWGSSVPLTFNAATGVWSVTRDMPTGEFKFRANDGWGINFGDNGADFKPEYDGSNINITAGGNYTISLDLSVGGNYAYTLKKN
ncbi:MAG TPA: SusE domain-containing protein [Chitinophagaceae bacterium]